MDILGQSSLLVGLTSFAFGFSVLARNVRNKLFISYAGVSTLVSAWALSFFFDKVWPDLPFYRFHLLFNVWLAPAVLSFIRFMVRIHDGISRALQASALLMAMLLSVALAFGMDSEDWVRGLVLFSPGFIVVQTLRLMWIDRRIKHGSFKRVPKLPTVGVARRNLIYVGALLVLASSVMDHVPWMGTVLPSIGNIGLSIYMFFVSQAITQQRLLNLPALFSRFLIITAVALTLTGVYSMLVAWIEDSPGLFFLNSFIASFLILMLLDPIRALVGYFNQRLLTRSHRLLQQALREAQRRLTGIVEPAALFQEILYFVEQTLQPESVALFVLASDGTRFRRVRSHGTEAVSQVREVMADNPLIAYCEQARRKGQPSILLDQLVENEIDRSASRTQREALTALTEGLRALGSNLMIPLFDGDRALGFVAMAAPSPPEPWGSNWSLLQIISPYFDRAGQTLRSMEVYVRSREKERLATLGEMAAGLAHEIRNPLGAIKGAAQYLDPAVDRPESRFLGVIVEEVDRLNRVVTQFLDYSKPPAVELREVDAVGLVRKAVELLGQELRGAGRAGISLTFEEPSLGQPALVRAAPEQVQQVLINLIQNSFKALEGRPAGRVRVTVESAGSEVVLGVEDDGPGIRREHMEKIFIPFFTTSPSGTGLGLPICQKIVEAHRGRIEVSSEEGKFSKFSVILPREGA
jgi:signal transduction histidine kinase